jgi:hypothetical protein
LRAGAVKGFSESLKMESSGSFPVIIQQPHRGPPRGKTQPPENRESCYHGA